MKTDDPTTENAENAEEVWRKAQGCMHKTRRGRCGKKATHAIVWQSSGMTLFRCKRHTYHVEGQAHSEEL